MSLAEIRGSPLGAKVGIIPEKAVSGPKVSQATVNTIPLATLKQWTPILTKTGIQQLPVKTTTIAPTQPQASVATIGMKTGASAQDIVGGLIQTGWGATPMGAILNTIGSAWGLAGQLATGTTKPVTVVEPKTSTTVNLNQNPLMGVVKAGAEQNLGNWYMQNPAVQKMLAVARTGMTVNALNKAGYGNIYLPGSSVPLSQEVAPVIYNKELGDVSKIAQQRWGESQNLLQPLQKGTVEGIVAKEYLQNTTTIYERIVERFTEYINQGGGGTPEAPKGTDWGLIAIIGIVAIAGVLLLGSFIKRS